MFDLSDDTLTTVNTKSTPTDRLPDSVTSGEIPSPPKNKLDEDQSQDLHRRLLSFYRQELDRQSENRFQMAIDEDYYDNIQWSDNDAQVLRDRGQAPTVYNVIAQSINWVTGSEKRGRTDFKILPRNKGETKAAELKTMLLKYVSDVNRVPFSRSRAFEDAIKVGIGWMEDGAQDDDDTEPVYSRYESWRNILHDSASTEMDFSDARYIFRSKWVDVDVAKAIFPDREAQIEDASVESSLFSGLDMADGDMAMDFAEFDRSNFGVSRTVVTHKRKRVRLIECEYRVPERVKKMKGGKHHGEIHDTNNVHHLAALQLGTSALQSKMMMRVHVAHMTVKDLLWEGVSPYKHNRFRFTPIWCYRRGRDNLPYGIIRGVRDIQDGVNKRHSKALHILSTNKVIMEEGILPDTTSLDEFTEEVSRADAMLVVKSGGLNRIKLDVDRDLAAPHLELMSRDISMIQQVGGVTDELLGRTTNAVSGIAVQKRQEQGTLSTNKPFDNLRFAAQMQGEIQLSLIEQFFTEQKDFRITNDRGVPDFHSINDGMPENDITRTKADFVISEAEWRSTMRQAASEQLMQMITQMPPDVGMLLLDLAIENMDDLPNRDEIAKRIRAKTGMKDPDQSEPTPEDIANENAAQEQQQYTKALAVAQLDKVQSDVDRNKAEAFRTMILAGREQAQTVNINVDSADKAMIAGQAVITMPSIARVADGVLKESGWNPQRNQQVPRGLPPLQGSQPMPMLQPPPQPPVQPPVQPMPEPMQAVPQPAPEPQQEILPPVASQDQQVIRQYPIGMPRPESLSSQIPLRMMTSTAETQSNALAMKAMQDMNQGTMHALNEVAQAISTMASAMKEVSKPKKGTFSISKNADGTFVGTKTEQSE